MWSGCSAQAEQTLNPLGSVRLHLDLGSRPSPKILSRPEEEPPISSGKPTCKHKIVATTVRPPVCPRVSTRTVSTHMQNSSQRRPAEVLPWCHTATSHAPPQLMLLGKKVLSAKPCPPHTKGRTVVTPSSPVPVTPQIAVEV